MTGKELKRKLTKLNVTQTELASKIGIPQSQLCRTFQSEDVKTGLLERICEVCDVDMTFFYPTPNKLNIEREVLTELLAQNMTLLNKVTKMMA